MSKIKKAREQAAERGIGKYERHVLLCIGPDCCSSEQGEKAWGQLKKAAAKINGSSDRGRLYRSKVGCLRICEYGPVGVVYPEGTWYGGLTAENLERVIDQDLTKGEVVEDLVIGRNPLPRPE